jgi:hypothetical protein
MHHTPEVVSIRGRGDHAAGSSLTTLFIALLTGAASVSRRPAKDHDRPRGRPPVTPRSPTHLLTQIGDSGS